MEHEEIKDLFSRYIDGDLLTLEKSAIESHLLTCADCKSDFEYYVRLREILFKPEPETNSEFFVQKVMSRIRQEEGSLSSHWSGLWWKGPAFAFALILILLLTPKPQDSSLTTGSLLLNNMTDERTQELLNSQTVQQDDVVSLFWG